MLSNYLYTQLQNKYDLNSSWVTLFKLFSNGFENWLKSKEAQVHLFEIMGFQKEEPQLSKDYLSYDQEIDKSKLKIYRKISPQEPRVTEDLFMYVKNVLKQNGVKSLEKDICYTIMKEMVAWITTTQGLSTVYGDKLNYSKYPDNILYFMDGKLVENVSVLNGEENMCEQCGIISFCVHDVGGEDYTCAHCYGSTVGQPLGMGVCGSDVSCSVCDHYRYYYEQEAI